MSDHPVTSTYRLQLHAGFGFSAARDVVPYLASLGVSHVYLSPILQAAPGSMHGYDVVDHTSVSTDLGGRDGFEALADTAHAHGLGLVVDVVPNHMALPTPLHLNRPLWETLRLGRDAATADWFDIDWDLLGGRVGLPILGAPLDEALATGELRLDTIDDAPVLAYHDQRLPLAPGSHADAEDALDLADVLARQHYVLAYWRDKGETLGYRRFFDVDTLVAVRVELPRVFEQTHRLLLSLRHAGLIDGFRIDHPDGLADPEGYFQRLRETSNDAWVVAEKILEGDERLPTRWPVAGSTGYDAARVISRALVPVTGAALDQRWRSIGGAASLSAVEQSAKRQVIDTLFTPELRRLTRLAIRAADDVGKPTSASQMHDALTEILVEVDVYRCYLRPGHAAERLELDRLAAQVERATAANPHLEPTCTVLYDLLTAVDTDSDAGRELIVRFQQVCGPVMAKGIEDTTFYRWHRLVALNEVGGDPAALDDPSAEPLHAWAAYQQRHHPQGLTTLSTHDTKRSEDVRARLSAVAGDIAAWDAVWSPVERLAADNEVDPPTAYLLMQTLLGAWPLDSDRLAAYMEKGVREAKQHTSWNDPDLGYEARVLNLAKQCVEDDSVTAALETALSSCADTVRAHTLAAKLLQLTVPGVPDVYQGCERLNLSLVDPDNRRAVDFASSAKHLSALDEGAAPADLGDEKLFVTCRTLRLRRRRPDLLGPQATYTPMPDLPAGLLGYFRGDHLAVLVPAAGTATEAAPGAASQGANATARVTLPEGRWRDELSGLDHQRDTTPAALFARLPVALLVREATSA